MSLDDTSLANTSFHDILPEDVSSSEYLSMEYLSSSAGAHFEPTVSAQAVAAGPAGDLDALRDHQTQTVALVEKNLLAMTAATEALDRLVNNRRVYAWVMEYHGEKVDFGGTRLQYDRVFSDC